MPLIQDGFDATAPSVERAAARHVPWRKAMTDALYGPAGFYRRPDGPGAHFRTSVHASSLFAEAVHELAQRSALSTVVDIGAGRGELLRSLRVLDPGARLIGVEIADRPADLPEPIEWLASMPANLTALVIANEWLDNVPLDVVELTADGPRVVFVDTSTGAESLGPPPDVMDAAWLARWWPLDEVGARAEVGRARDEAWASVVRALGRGIAVAIDYGHTLADRPSHGTVAAYCSGRHLPPVPDGKSDITTHVAMDSCAAAGERAGAHATRLVMQREALRELGLDGRRPDRTLAESDPAAYVRALARATEAAELTDTGGLGGFYWLEQRIDRGR